MFSALQDSDGYRGVDWLNPAMSKPDDRQSLLDGFPWQGADIPRSASDRSSSLTDSPSADTDRAARSDAEWDMDAAIRRLWASVRGRLLIIALTISMLASVIVLSAWICLR